MNFGEKLNQTGQQLTGFVSGMLLSEGGMAFS